MAVPEWIKVTAGSLALLIGASAPTLVLYAINPSVFIPFHLASGAPPVRQMPNGVSQLEGNRHSQKDDDEKSFPRRLADDPVTVLTLVVAVATAALAVVTWQAAKDTRRALLLAQRPCIRIRNVVVKPPRFYGGRIFHPHELALGQLYIVNVGGTEARLIEAHCEMYWNSPDINTLPTERPYEGQDAGRFRGILQPGESVPLPFGSDIPIGDQESDQILSGKLNIWVLGFVGYSDQLGIVRRTAFCRKYDHVRRRFFAEADPDYEHEE